MYMKNILKKKENRAMEILYYLIEFYFDETKNWKNIIY